MENQNYFELLEDLKKKIDNHKKEVEQREKIFSEFKDVASLLNDVRDYIRQLQRQYSLLPTVKLRQELDEYMKEEQDYLLLMNEYASKINSLNHSFNYEKENEFLQLALEFQKVSDRLKELERLSKKFGSKKTIGTNRVKTVSADGRTKEIHEQYLAEYIELTKRKKELLPVYRKQREEFLESHAKQQASVDSVNPEASVDYYNNERLGIAPNYIPTEEEYDQMSNQDKINLEEKYYEDMTLEEKISYCKDVINKILNAKNTGKKEYIKIHGQQYYVPIKMKGLFYEYSHKLDLLTSEQVKETSAQKDSDVADKQPSALSVVDNNTSMTVANPGMLNAVPESVLGEYVGNDIAAGPIYDTDYEDVYSNDNASTLMRVDDKVTDLSIIGHEEDDDKVVFAGEETIDDENKKQKGGLKDKVLKILKSRKPKNLKGLIKKLVAATLAITAAIAAFVSANSFAKKDSKPDVDDSSTIEQFIDEENQYPTDDDIIDSTIKKGESEVNHGTKKPENDGVPKPNDTNPVKTDSDDSKSVTTKSSPIKIGDKVCISKDIIYSDVYSAMNDENGLPAYHDNDMIREVYGIFLSNGENYRYIVQNQDRVDELVSQGWEVKSVVMKNAGGFEGAEPIENIVKVQENEIGGRSK